MDGTWALESDWFASALPLSKGQRALDCSLANVAPAAQGCLGIVKTELLQALPP